MSEEIFDEWNEVKKDIHKSERKLSIKTREIFWANIGQNIGFEQNGKGKNFARPIIVVKKLTKDLFLGIPTTTTLREDNDYFHKFKYTTYNNEVLNVSALILQVKVFSIKRLMNKIRMIHKEDFNLIIEKSKNLFGPT
jgi:mRNA interferase MazF